MRQQALPTTDRGEGRTELRVQEASERLRALLKEHDGLLAKVGRRRAARQRLEQEIRAMMARVGAVTEPLADAARRLDRAIHEMMDSFAADGARSRRERDALRRLHQYLDESGVISPRGYWAAREADEPDDEEDDDDDGAGPRGQSRGRGGEWQERTARSAVRPPVGDKGLLRALYRRLVEAMHPDQVQDEAEKTHRTEVMKEVTVAYQAGDFARLVELERTWATSAPVSSRDGDDELARRREVLESAIVELRRQLRGLDREVRGLRGSSEGKLTTELKKRSRHGDEMAAVTAEARAELARLELMHEHVRRYRDGESSLEELLAGPNAQSRPDAQSRPVEQRPGRERDREREREPPSRGKARGARAAREMAMDDAITVMAALMLAQTERRAATPAKRRKGAAAAPAADDGMDLIELLAVAAEALGEEPDTTARSGRRGSADRTAAQLAHLDLGRVADALAQLAAMMDEPAARRGKRGGRGGGGGTDDVSVELVESLASLASAMRDAAEMGRKAGAAAARRQRRR